MAVHAPRRLADSRHERVALLMTAAHVIVATSRAATPRRRKTADDRHRAWVDKRLVAPPPISQAVFTFLHSPRFSARHGD